MAVYQINKGIGRSPEFKGLRSGYLFIFAGGLLAILIAFMVLYMAGVNQWICITLGVISASVLVWATFHLNAKYGEWGLMKMQALLGLTDKERAQILSINLSNAPGRKYKEVWIGLGGAQSAVYATEVSPEEYYCYITEETEKLELQRLTEKLDGNIELAIKQIAESKRSK